MAPTTAMSDSVRVNTRNRKLKTQRKRPVSLESAEQIVAMIHAATELDAKPGARTAGRRALIAMLVYAGLQIGEATALRWRDINLANGRISVGDAKTDAGIRLVDILPALRDELTSHRPRLRTQASGPLLPHLQRDPPRQGQRPRARHPPGRQGRRGAARRPRRGPAPGRRDRAQAAPHVRLDSHVRGEDPCLRHCPARAHRSGASRCASTPTPCVATKARRSGWKRSSRTAVGHQRR